MAKPEVKSRRGKTPEAKAPTKGASSVIPETLEQTYRYRGFKSLEYLLTYAMILSNPIIGIITNFPRILPH